MRERERERERKSSTQLSITQFSLIELVRIAREKNHLSSRLAKFLPKSVNVPSSIPLGSFPDESNTGKEMEERSGLASE